MVCIWPPGHSLPTPDQIRGGGGSGYQRSRLTPPPPAQLHQFTSRPSLSDQAGHSRHQRCSGAAPASDVSSSRNLDGILCETANEERGLSVGIEYGSAPLLLKLDRVVSQRNRIRLQPRRTRTAGANRQVFVERSQVVDVMCLKSDRFTPLPPFTPENTFQNVLDGPLTQLQTSGNGTRLRFKEERMKRGL